VTRARSGSSSQLVRKSPPGSWRTAVRSVRQLPLPTVLAPWDSRSRTGCQVHRTDRRLPMINARLNSASGRHVGARTPVLNGGQQGSVARRAARYMGTPMRSGPSPGSQTKRESPTVTMARSCGIRERRSDAGELGRRPQCGPPKRSRARLLRLGDGPSATPELDGELLGRQVAHQLLLSGEPRRRYRGGRAPAELAGL
jgi:hypothetical protein